MAGTTSNYQFPTIEGTDAVNFPTTNNDFATKADSAIKAVDVKATQAKASADTASAGVATLQTGLQSTNNNVTSLSSKVDGVDGTWVDISSQCSLVAAGIGAVSGLVVRYRKVGKEIKFSFYCPTVNVTVGVATDFYLTLNLPQAVWNLISFSPIPLYYGCGRAVYTYINQSDPNCIKMLVPNTVATAQVIKVSGSVVVDSL